MMVACLKGEESTTQMVFSCKTPQIYSVPSLHLVMTSDTVLIWIDISWMAVS